MSQRTPAKAKTKKTPTSPHKKTHKSRKTFPAKSFVIKLSIVFLVAIVSWVIYLDAVVRAKFEGKRWEIPARVYALSLIHI